MFGLGTWEILLILIAALVFIGPSKLPSLARTMGKGMRDVRRAMAGFEDEVRQASTIPDTPAPAVTADKGVDAPPVPATDPTTANTEPSDDAPSPDEPLNEGEPPGTENDSHHV
jgi:sec-independent protein translocase protein TatA